SAHCSAAGRASRNWPAPSLTSRRWNAEPSENPKAQEPKHKQISIPKSQIPNQAAGVFRTLELRIWNSFVICVLRFGFCQPWCEMGLRVVLLPRRARPFYGRHPWVYAGAIAAVEGTPADGDEVDLCSHAGNFVARGLYNSQSKIRVRLYSWSAATPLARAFFRDRLAAAIHLRGPMLGLDGPGRACRLVFSEGDGLPGLTVDRYDRWLVVQFTALGLAQRRDLFVELLVELTRPEGIFLRTERGLGQLEGLELHDGLLWGSVPPEPVVVAVDGR